MPRNLHSISVRMRIRNVDSTSGRTQQAVFSELQSDMGRDITNELPLLIHALTIVTQQQSTHRGFNYTMGRFIL